MADVVTTIRSSAFRAWHNALRIPSGIDRDDLLAAGVILDEDDWQLWKAKGWFAFMMRASVSDAQQVALFGLVQAALKDRQLAALPPELADAIEAHRQAELTHLGNCWLPEGKDESTFGAAYSGTNETRFAVRMALGSLVAREVAEMAKEQTRRRSGASA